MSEIEAIPTALLRTILSFGNNAEAWNLAGSSRGLRDAVESIAKDCLEKIRVEHHPDELFDDQVDRAAEDARALVRAREFWGGEEDRSGPPRPFLHARSVTALVLALAAVVGYVHFFFMPLPTLILLVKVAAVGCGVYCGVCFPSLESPLPWRLKIRCAAFVPLEVVEPFESEVAAICCLPEGRHLAVLVCTGHLQVFELATWICVTSIDLGLRPEEVWPKIYCSYSADHVVIWNKISLMVWGWDPSRGMLHSKYARSALATDPARRLSGQVQTVTSEGDIYLEKSLNDDSLSIEVIDVSSGEQAQPVIRLSESHGSCFFKYVACGGFLLGHAPEGIEVISRSDLARNNDFFPGGFSELHGSPNGEVIVLKGDDTGDLSLLCLREWCICPPGSTCMVPVLKSGGAVQTVELISDREVFSQCRDSKVTGGKKRVASTRILVHDAIPGQLLRTIVHPTVKNQECSKIVAAVAENRREIIVAYRFGSSCVKPIHRYVATSRSYTA